MSIFRSIATSGVTALVGLGLGASGASAYSISGGAYTATATANPTFTIGGAYQQECTVMTAAGDATGAATTAFTPSFSGCTLLGFPTFVTQSGPWLMTVGSGPVGGVFGVDIEIPVGTTTTLSNPIWGCTLTISGPQVFSMVGVASNDPGVGVEVAASVTGIAYTATGCPYTSGSDGTYETNGPVSLPGVTIS